MKSEASILATQIRYQQWIQDIQECNARPTGVTVNDWCAEHHINRNSYYYRMKVLRRSVWTIYAHRALPARTARNQTTPAL